MNGTDRRRTKALRNGKAAETAAVVFLRCKGYRILARRYRVDGGEIDIVAGKHDTIVFVEVKTRQTLAQALVAITPTKRLRLSRAARVWLAVNPRAAGATLRGDAVYIAPWRWPRHHVAAIELDIG